MFDVLLALIGLAWIFSLIKKDDEKYDALREEDRVAQERGGVKGAIRRADKGSCVMQKFLTGGQDNLTNDESGFLVGYNDSNEDHWREKRGEEVPKRPSLGASRHYTEGYYDNQEAWRRSKAVVVAERKADQDKKNARIASNRKDMQSIPVLVAIVLLVAVVVVIIDSL